MLEVHTIGRQVQVIEEIVRQGLGQVRAVNLEGHEHDDGEEHDAQVHLANQSSLLAPRPPCRGIEPMHILPVRSRPVLLGRLGVVKDAGQRGGGLVVVLLTSLPKELLLLEGNAQAKVYVCFGSARHLVPGLVFGVRDVDGLSLDRGLSSCNHSRHFRLSVSTIQKKSPLAGKRRSLVREDFDIAWTEAVAMHCSPHVYVSE